MKTLKNCIKLSCSIKIYVPSTQNIDKKIDSSEWVDKSLSLMSNLFGGATSSKSLGAWTSASGNLIKEDIILVLSYVNQQELEKNIDEIYNFCLKMKFELGQESIALEVNNELYLI